MLNAMQEAGLPCPETLYTDGKLYRFGQSKSCWYILFESDGIRAGAFGCWRLGISENWSSKSLREFSPDERRAYAKQIEAAKRLREAEQAKVQAECREWCARAWKECQPADPQHPYLVRKKIKPYGIKQLEDALLVPLSSAGIIYGIQFIKPDGEKRFKVGTAKQGNCFKIGDLTDTVVICEGFATGASIHEATGHCVIVAFDAGNLKPVAESLKIKLSGRELIIAADNDAWEKLPDGSKIKGKAADNIGIVKAKECGLPVIVPQFKDTSTFPTDFNDLHCLEGLDQVKWGFSPKDEEPPPLDDGDYCEYPPVCDEPADEPAPNNKADNPFFLYLGYDQGSYYYLPHGTLQVTSLKPSEHTEGNLVSLAPLAWWESECHGKQGANWSMARNMMLRKSEAQGIYTTSSIRGRGAWWDADRSIIHLGDQLVVDGKKTPIRNIKSEYIYEAATKIPYDAADRPIGNKEAVKLLELCNMLSWEKPINGYLLAGWCVLAPICGALSWRPHIWLTGGAGTGKSFLFDNLIRPLVGTSALVIQGNTSEAGIRQELMHDARPVIYDEAEGENPEAQRRMQGIIELARQASSESSGSIIKGSQGGKAVRFSIRSMFAFASIGISAKQQADQSRITVLGLRRPGGASRFDAIKALVNETTRDPEFNRGLRARSIEFMPQMIQNAEPFIRAVAERTDSQRTGDQLGWLLAGTFSLTSSKPVTLDFARGWVNERDWNDHVVGHDQADERRCLAAIMEHMVRVDSGETFNIAELITMASGSVMDNTCLAAQATLQRYGIKFVDGGFAVSNTHTAISKMLEKTPWSSNWGRILGRLEGATKPPAGIWIGGGTSRVVMLPLRYAREE